MFNMSPTAKEEKKSIEAIIIRKEERKRWKEERLIKKLQKQQQLEVKVEPIPPKAKELSTVSIAVPGSILENAQSAELQTYLAGQIARAACIYQIDEIIVFDDAINPNVKKFTINDSDGVKNIPRCCLKFARILQYLECPQYLRKHFFPVHNDLQYAGILNPLDSPHHLRQIDTFQFREGVVTNKTVKAGRGSLVNIGLLKDVQVDKLLTANLRCTIKILPQTVGQKKLKGVIVPPSRPRQETGVYWGYNVRLANSLAQVFSQSPYKKGYDISIGTSDKGSPVANFICPKYKHLLIVFGGLQGLEAALENDEVLNIDDPRLLFDNYLNTVPNQGSRIVRTEEAILITLTALQPLLNPKRSNTQFNQEKNSVNVE